jgi:hypothetical protein
MDKDTKSRGRPAGFRMDDSHRTKIANSQILNRLIKCAEGDLELTSTQVTVGLALLKKVLPDLASVDDKGNTAGLHVYLDGKLVSQL